MCHQVHAQAFTHGNDIYFSEGQVNPNTSSARNYPLSRSRYRLQPHHTIPRIGIYTVSPSFEVFNFYCRHHSGCIPNHSHPDWWRRLSGVLDNLPLYPQTNRKKALENRRPVCLIHWTIFDYDPPRHATHRQKV